MFGGRLLEPSAVATALAAFAIFCALSGAVYLFNDVADREADRNHPLKRERPIASGQLSTTSAVTAGVVLGVAGVATAFAIGHPVRRRRRRVPCRYRSCIRLG